MPPTTTKVVEPVRTVGLARKIAAAVGAQTVALLVNLIASGSFDRVEFAQLVGVALTIVLGWITRPGKVEVQA